MATQKEIEATYDYMDDIFRMSLGNHADITNAMYNGDFSLTLEQAQEAKHDYILEGINFKKGDRILDIGCGWGPMLKVIKNQGGEGIGLTLSPDQVRACESDGLTAMLRDWKTLDAEELGAFDGIICVGAFEHFCSIEELRDGKQDGIYDRFFKLCRDLLKPRGRLYLQTMMWGDNVPKVEDLDVSAPKLSDQWVLGHVAKYYPGSWLPNGLEHIQKCASPCFKLLSKNDGRLDYIHTMEEWGKYIMAFSLKKLLYSLKLIPKYLFDKNFQYQMTSFFYYCNTLCFKRRIMTHQRIVFEKK
ncbi:MAG TPA: class I SAM-dependent methyltransferase [Candidatus Paceibacterota bacterium]